MNKKCKIVLKHIATVLLICIIVFTFNFIFVSADHSDIVHEEITLNDGWEVIVKNHDGGQDVYSNANLDIARFPMLNKGDVVIMSRQLPKVLPIHPMLRMYTVHSTINVNINNEAVYSYGEELYKANELLGYGNHYMYVDKDMSEKDITIVMEISENDASSTITSPLLICGDYAYRDYIIQNRSQIFITIFIIVFGVIVTIISAFYLFKNKELSRLIGVGLFSVFIGIWFMCNTNIMELFTYDLKCKTFLEFGTLYAAPTFLFYYLGLDVRKMGGKQYIVYRFILIWQTVFMVASWLLQLANIIHFPVLLKLCQLNMCIMVMFLLVRYVLSMMKGVARDGPVVRGFILLSVFVISDIVRFNFQKYSDKSSNEHYVSMIHIGVLVFVIALISDFAVSYLNGVYERAEKDALAKLAYSDHLTGLSNKRAIEEYMDKLDSDNNDYSIIGYDLNNLKKVNDTLGHEEGDRYIKEFAGILEKVFGDIGQSARTGGDEFITVLPHGKAADKEALLAKLNEQIDILNSNNTLWTMSTAYGYCDYDEKGVDSIRDASRIADERMYENKKRMKASR